MVEMGDKKDRAGRGAHVLENPAVVVKEKQRFAIGDAPGVDFNLVVGVTVGNEEVDVAVVVVIEKAQAPATHRSSQFSHSVCR